MRSYRYDSQKGIFVRPDNTEFRYSDGTAVEERLLSVIMHAADVSSLSQELAGAITDWPSEYHLSPARHNLLRFLDLQPAHRILELGCGCGAISRYLGEKGATIVAVEGSPLRAQIAAERCRGLPNVRIVCDNLIDFTDSERFDYVILIGVIEYAPCYHLTDDPVHAYIERARSFLKPGGIVVVAIENQMGLQYFNGWPEDHHGVPYYGLHGLYRHDEAVTFGRSKLEKLFTAAGLPIQRFFYPFPDYKLPSVIISEAACTVPGFDVAALLTGLSGGKAHGVCHPHFHESLVWRTIVENGLMPHMANAFLVLAAESEEALAAPAPTWLASSYTHNRRPAYATETRFHNSDGGVVVAKERLAHAYAEPEVILHGGRLLHLTDAAHDYVIGQPYVLELQQRLARGEGLSAICEWAAPWLGLLLANVSRNGEGDFLLPGSWLDAIPQNFIRTAAGNLQRIDEEWVLTVPIPLDWIVVRGLSSALAIAPTSAALAGISLRETLCSVAAGAGIRIDDRALQRTIGLESELRSAVFGVDQDRAARELVVSLGEPPHDALHAPTHYDALITENRWLAGELRRIKSTWSWQVTKPLRLLANLPRLLKQRFKSS